MARIPTQSSGDRVTSAIWNNLRADYLSQTDTTIQAIASSFDMAAGKRPKFPFAYFNPTTAPAATEGHVYYDSTEKKLRLRDDTQWRDIPATVGAGGAYKLPSYYTIYKDGATYYAMDRDGDIDYSGAAYHTVYNNAALACNTAGGGTLHHTADTFVLAGRLTIYGNTVTEGEGEATVLQYPFPAPNVGAIGRSWIENVNVAGATQDTHITLRNFAIDGQYAGAGIAGPETFSGINFQGVVDVLVDNLYIHNTPHQGIRFWGGVAVGLSERMYVTKCFVEHCGYNGIHFVAPAGELGNCRRGMAIGNFVTDVDIGFVSYRGQDIHFIGNHAWDCNNDWLLPATNNMGIAMEQDSEDCIIMGNKIQECNAGIWIDNAAVNGQIVNNQIDGCKTSIAAGQNDTTGVVVMGNRITRLAEDFADTPRIGIEVGGTGATIVGNIVEGGDKICKAIVVDGDRNLVANNLIYDVGIIGSSGIFIGNSLAATSNFVHHNYIIDSDGTHLSNGIVLNSGGAGDADNNFIDDNYIYQCNTAISISAGADNNKVRRNIFDSNTSNISDGGAGNTFNQAQVNSIFDDSDAGGQSALSNYGDHMSIGITDDGATDTTVRFNFIVPDDFTEAMSANLYVVSLCTGANVMRWNVTSDFGTADEAYNLHSDAVASTDTTMAANALEAIDISGALTGAAAGDRVGIAFIAEASHANYTLGAVLHILNFALNYI